MKQAVQRSYFLVSSYFFYFFFKIPTFLFSFATCCLKMLCITFTIIKVNILHNISPNLENNIISFDKMYTLSQIVAVHNEVN